jgi:hypothetical protein
VEVVPAWLQQPRPMRWNFAETKAARAIRDSIEPFNDFPRHVREAERKRRMVAMHASADTIAPLAGVSQLDEYCGKRNVVPNADQNAYHSIMPKTVGVEWIP